MTQDLLLLVVERCFCHGFRGDTGNVELRAIGDYLRSTSVPRTPYGMTKASGARRLREWMKKNGKTQKQFGALLGAQQASVSTWLLGRPPSLPYALRIRDLTGIPIESWDRTYVSGRVA